MDRPWAVLDWVNDVAKKAPPNKTGRTTTRKVQATENQPIVLPEVSVRPDHDTDPAGDDGLTIRQRLFVDALAGPALGNATRAAELAGYAAENRVSLASTASENLRKPQVQSALALALAKRRMTPEWAEAVAYDMAGASMANFLSVTTAGEPEFDWIKAAEAGAIGHIREYREEGGGTGGTDVVIVKRSFKLFDRQKAIDTVLKLQGKLKDVTRHEGAVGIAHDPDALKKLMAVPDAFEAAIRLADSLAAAKAATPDGRPEPAGE